MTYQLTLVQLRRMPPLIGYLQDALNERAEGHANAADEIDAIRKAATWEGKGGDAAMYAVGRSVVSFDMSQSEDKKLAAASNDIYNRSITVVRKIDDLVSEAQSEGFQVHEDENRVRGGLNNGKDAHDNYERVTQLQAKLDAISREGEAVDLDFGRLLATATSGADSSSEFTPIDPGGKTVVMSAPPEGVLEGTGYWVIDPDKPQPGSTKPAGVPGNYSFDTDPNFKLNVGPTSDYGYPMRNWSSAPFGEYSESYRFRITGTEFTGQTKMVQVDGKWYQAEWQNYKYEYRQNQNFHMNSPDWVPTKDLPNVNQSWKPISVAGIVDISHRLPDTKIWLPDTCGGKVTLVNGSVVGPNFKTPEVMYAPRS